MTEYYRQEFCMVVHLCVRSRNDFFVINLHLLYKTILFALKRVKI
jgi:hypothetical protein